MQSDKTASYRKFRCVFRQKMTISVSQLNNYIHGVFDIDGVLGNVSVCGEVTNVKRSREGWYFSLKDDVSAIDCFCYGMTAEPIAGMLAVAEGKINFWVKSGRVSFFVRRLTASKNTGAAYLKFLELKEKLQKEGLFDEVRKKPVPKFCMKIGVVTSVTGAVIHDIENVVHRRQPFSDIVLFPVKVQGEGADVEIAAGVRYFSASDVDAVIVGRGGGSNEDLSAFNSEIVVRAVAECQKPVVSAVGHGVDFTLCDFAADRRAVTPSEAAEFVTTDCQALKSGILSRLLRTSALLKRQLSDNKNAALFAAKRISSELAHNVQDTKATVKFCLSRDSARVQGLISAEKAQLQNVTDRLSAANPANVLKRGFAYLDCDGKRIYSARQVEQGSKLTVKLSDGELETTVERVKL